MAKNQPEEEEELEEEELEDEEERALQRLEELVEEEDEIRDHLVDRTNEVIDMNEEDLREDVRRLSGKLVRLVGEELFDTIREAERIYMEKLQLGVDPEDALKWKRSFIKMVVTDIGVVIVAKLAVMLVKELGPMLAVRVRRSDLMGDIAREMALELSIRLDRIMSDLYYELGGE